METKAPYGKYHIKKEITMISLLVSLMMVFTLCTDTAAGQETITGSNDTCRTWKDAEKLSNTNALICGRLQKFTPWEEGKGAGHMFWQFEIKLADGTAIPVVNMDRSDGESIPFDEYVNNNVLIHGTVFYGIIIGDSNPEHQSMTGFRIDAESIVLVLETIPLNTTDTCWVYADIQSHPGMDVICAGMLREYVPPHDNSKLGDEKIWDYELETQDGYKVPLNNLPSVNFDDFKDKDVFIKANIKYGIIFGSENTANLQGYRIDPVDIYANEKGYGNTLIERKIRLDLTKFNEDGYRVHPDGEKSAASYEFCIPANDSALAEVKAIDPTAGEMKGSKGRSGCSDKEWLVIGSTRQSGFKNVLSKLSELKYIRKITETFWE